MIRPPSDFYSAFWSWLSMIDVSFLESGRCKKGTFCYKLDVES